jgi:hypothetical protein
MQPDWRSEIRDRLINAALLPRVSLPHNPGYGCGA